MSRFTATLDGCPRGKERARAAIPWPWVFSWIAGGKRGQKPSPRVYTRSEYMAWEASVADRLAAAWKADGHSSGLDEPCSLLLTCFFPRPKGRTRKTLPNPRYPHAVVPDGDNVAKAVQDGLQKGGLVKNDSRVFDLRVVKWVCSGEEAPRIEIALAWGPGCTLPR